jgi:S1-C subfamily serine protease
VLAKNLGVEGIGFAIPVNLVRGVMSEILTKGRVVRGWIGILPIEVDEFEAQRFNLAQPGIVIAKLYEQSPATDAGLQLRDIILTVNGAPVKSVQDTLTRIAQVKPGKKIKITGIRGADRFATEVQVSEKLLPPTS